MSWPLMSWPPKATRGTAAEGSQHGGKYGAVPLEVGERSCEKKCTADTFNHKHYLGIAWAVCVRPAAGS